MRNRNPWIALTVALLFSAVARAEGTAKVSFDYDTVEAKKQIAYPSELQVELTNVNTIDYTYDVKVTFQPPQPRLPSTAGPRLGIENATDHACETEREQRLIERKSSFGTDELEKWYTSLKACQVEGEPWAQKGELALGAKELGDALTKAGPGGSVTITVTAKLNEPAPDDEKNEKIANHLKTRTYVVEFTKPEGIQFAFGPYLSGTHRVEYDQVRNPNHDPMDPMSSEYLIGVTEDSDLSYGVAAYWIAPFNKKESWGISWGVAYNLENEIDTAVNGLVGMYYRLPAKKGGLLLAGAAVAREHTLAGGFTLDGPIGENEEIPMTTKTKVRWFAGYGFQF